MKILFWWTEIIFRIALEATSLYISEIQLSMCIPSQPWNFHLLENSLPEDLKPYGEYNLEVSPFRGFPGSTNGKEPSCQCRRHKRWEFSSWVRKILWRRKGQPTQYSCGNNSVGRGTWRATVHGVTKSQAWIEHSTPSKVRLYNTATTSSISYYSHEQLEEGHNCFFFISPFVPLVSFEMLIGTIFIVTDKMHTQRHLFSCADSPIQVFLVLIDFMTK